MLSKFNSKVKFIKVKNVNRTIIKIVYFIKHSKENILNRNMAKRMVSNYNKKVDLISEFKNKIKDLYLLGYNVNIFTCGSYDIFEFNLFIPKENIIDEFNLDEAMKFFFDNIYNPLVNNNSFKSEQFNFEKNFLLEKMKNYPSSIYEYTSDKFFDFYDENKEFNTLHIDEYKNYLNEVNEVDSYKFYLDNIINNKKHITYIFGNLDNKQKILDSYNKYFKNNNYSFKLDNKYFSFKKLLDYKEKEEITKYNQSVLQEYYQIKDISEKDEHLLIMLTSFLNDKENNLLFKNIRIKHNLIYDLYITYDCKNGNLELSIYFNIEDKDCIKKIIKKTFEDIKDKNNFNTYKNNLIRALKYDLDSALDERFFEAANIINSEISHFTSLEERLKISKKIKYEDMLDFLNRVVLTREMTFIAGDKK